MHQAGTGTKRSMTHNAHFVARHKMGQDHGCGIVMQRGLDHFARVDASLRQGATEQFVHRDHAVLSVEGYADKNLVLFVGQCQLQILANGAGRIERRAL